MKSVKTGASLKNGALILTTYLLKTTTYRKTVEAHSHIYYTVAMTGR